MGKDLDQGISGDSSAAEKFTPAPKMLGKDQILGALIDFFEDEMRRDGMGTCDWIAQGEWEVDAFVAAMKKLKTELKLRD